MSHAEGLATVHVGTVTRIAATDDAKSLVVYGQDRADRTFKVRIPATDRNLYPLGQKVRITIEPM